MNLCSEMERKQIWGTSRMPLVTPQVILFFNTKSSKAEGRLLNLHLNKSGNSARSGSCDVSTILVWAVSDGNTFMCNHLFYLPPFNGPNTFIQFKAQICSSELWSVDQYLIWWVPMPYCQIYPILLKQHIQSLANLWRKSLTSMQQINRQKASPSVVLFLL